MAPKRPPNDEWKHFLIIKTDATTNRPLKVRCRHCNWTGSAHATRCKHHYIRAHKSQSQLCLVSSMDASQSSSSSQPSESTESSTPPPCPLKPLFQTRLLKFGDRTFSKDEQRRAEEYLSMLQVRHGLSLHALASKEMKLFVGALRCDFNLPASSTLQRRGQALFQRVKTEVEERLRSAKVVSLACDGWEDLSHNEVFGIIPRGLVLVNSQVAVLQRLCYAKLPSSCPW